MTRNEEQALRPGHVVALVGALVVVAALWRPWYALDVPQSLRDALASEGARAASAGSVLGSIAQTLAAALPPRVDVDAWQAFRVTDVVLCVEAVLAGGLVLAVAGALGGGVRAEPAAVSRWVTRMGVGGLLLVVRRILVLPAGGGGAYGITVHVAQGAWMALVGCALVAAGGALAAGGRGPKPENAAAAQLPPEAAPATPEDRALTSVAPPRMS